MKVKFNIKNIGDFNKENYINKPILRCSCPVGIIQNVKIDKDIIEIEGEIWDRFININIEHTIEEGGTEKFNCLELEIKDYKSKVQDNKNFQNQMDIENAEFSIIYGC